MRRTSIKGLYHLALIITVITSFNWAFIILTGVNLAERLFLGVTIPNPVIGIGVCVSAILVLWHNWAD